MSDNDNSETEIKSIFNRSTLEVARSVIDSEVIATRSKKYLKEEARLGFLSVWSAFNAAFSVIVDLYEDKNIPEDIRTRLESIYKGIPVGFNLPLENRIPPDMRKFRLQDADEVRETSDAPSKIIVKGYNDPESLKQWDELKEERETEARQNSLN